MKKFDVFGRSLSKTEQKKIMGGLEDEGDGGGGCSISYQCSSASTISCSGKYCQYEMSGQRITGVKCDNIATCCPGE